MAEEIGNQQTELLHELEEERADAKERRAKEHAAEQLKNRVSVAAIIITTALSFIANVRSERADTVDGAKSAAESARRQSAELWAYYQTKLSERTALEIARDRVRLDLARRGLSRAAPEVKLDALRLSEYEERIQNFDNDTQLVFFRVQDLQKEEDVKERETFEPARAILRYELGMKLMTLALIILSVTILSNRQWLFWSGSILGVVGLLLAFNGYFLFV